MLAAQTPVAIGFAGGCRTSPSRKIRSCLGGVIFLGRSHSRRVGARIGGRGREWLGGIVTTLSPGNVVKGPTGLPWLSAHPRPLKLEDARR